MMYWKWFLVICLLVTSGCKLDSFSSGLKEEVDNEANLGGSVPSPSHLFQCVAASGLWGEPDVDVVLANGERKSQYGFFSGQRSAAATHEIFIMPEGIYRLTESTSKLTAAVNRETGANSGAGSESATGSEAGSVAGSEAGSDIWIRTLFKDRAADEVPVYSGDFTLLHFGSDGGLGQFARVVPREAGEVDPAHSESQSATVTTALRAPLTDPLYREVAEHIQAILKQQVESFSEDLAQMVNMEVYSTEYEQLQEEFSEAAVGGDTESLELAEEKIAQLLQRPLESAPQAKQIETQLRAELSRDLYQWAQACKGVVSAELLAEVQNLRK